MGAGPRLFGASGGEEKDKTMGRSSATLQPATRPSKIAPRPQTKEGHRDTVEAIVVAFILALVVRGFEAQAFVIPTGSMAPTLTGRHKEIACEECGFVFTVNASQEVESHWSNRSVYSGVCVNCRFKARLDTQPSFKGDRILVMMFPYDLPGLPGSGGPARWDVVVFRYPEDPEISYIKRLVGLPGEVVRIFHGDIYIKPPGGDAYSLTRKPLKHQSAMQINVYDDRHQSRTLAPDPQWRRWRSESDSWQTPDPSASRYQSRKQPGEWCELRYHNLVPEPDQWSALRHERPLPRPARASLITDFYSYNTNIMFDDPENRLADGQIDQDAWMQPHWVGDLTLEANLDIQSVDPDAAVRLELVKAGIPHRCTIDLASGTAVVTRGEVELGRWDTPIKGKGRYHIEYGNVDDRVSLLVDGRAPGNEGFEYESPESVPIPTEADLRPAAIAARNAEVTVSDLVLKRDIYYTQYPSRFDYGMVWEDRYPHTSAELFDFLSDPSRFPSLANVRSHEYEIGSDRYFMLGDNSPCSKDSRGWGSDDAAWDTLDRKPWEVPRPLLTGKAFFIYWPHGIPIGPNVRYNFLIRPYFERMRWIR
jgi:signal peptidase I